MALEITVILRTFGAKRTILYPEGCTYLCLYHTLGEMFGWFPPYPHRFIIGDRVIKDGRDGSEDEIRTFIDEEVSGGVYDCGDFVMDLNIRKIDGKAVDTPQVTVSKGLFPFDGCTPEEWSYFLQGKDVDPEEMKELENTQDPDYLNQCFTQFWTPLPPMKGRIGPVNCQIIEQLLMLDIPGYAYEVATDRIMKKNLASRDSISIRTSDSEIISSVAERFATRHGISGENLIHAILEQHPVEWGDHISEISREILVGWATPRDLYPDTYFTEDELQQIMDSVESFFNGVFSGTDA